MSSALACVGLAVSDDAEFNLLLKHALTDIREIGTFGGVYVGRWQDDSGAALILRTACTTARSRTSPSPTPGPAAGCSPTAG
ncbi:MAG TPA: hypothetical protein VFQ68_09975 [Streptosporangiaceae bacterium]|nr:hypothetical protein [Streptosporangiaceae bacterium]